MPRTVYTPTPTEALADLLAAAQGTWSAPGDSAFTPLSAMSVLLSDVSARPPGTRWYVNASTGDDSDGATTWGTACATVSQAVSLASAGDDILVAPGEYDEAVTVPREKSNLTIVGVGGRGAAFIAPSTTDATAVTVLADDCTLVNIGCDGDGTGSGLVNYGRRTRAYACKIEGGTIGLKLTLGTVAQIGDGTHGKGDDCWFVDCEFAWNTNGVKFYGTDYGAVTEAHFRGCLFHDNSAADFEEADGTGGSAAVRFAGLDIGDCRFLRQQDGTEPTKYLSLNDDNGNKGVVHGCTFPTALDGGHNLVSTGLIFVGNFMTGGISTGQPS